MKYTDLTIHQRISLKGHFLDDPACINYKAICMFWGFIKAVEYFLNDDLSQLDI